LAVRDVNALLTQQIAALRNEGLMIPA